MGILISWLIYTLAIMLTSYLLPGVVVDNFWSALATAAVIGIVNTFLRPLLLFLTLPLNVLTFGLFTFVINALLIMLAASIVPGFVVQDFWWALIFSLVLSLISSVLNSLFPTNVRSTRQAA